MKLKFAIVSFFFLWSLSSKASDWQQLADFGAEGRHRGTAISIGTKGYMGLGHYNGTGNNIIKSDWWEYDPATNAWTQKSDHPAGNYGVIAFSVGSVGYVGSGQISSNFYKYDPSTNSWTLMGATPASFNNSTSMVVQGRPFCFVAGSNQLFEYEYLTDSWIAKNAPPFSVGFWTCSFAIGEKGYIKTSNSLWEYKPFLDEWIQRAQYPGIATSGSVAFEQYGMGYVVCGYGGSLSNVTSEVWEFNPMANQWNLLEEFPGTSRRFSAGFSIGNKCFMGTGTNGTNFGDFWQFDALANFEGQNMENLSIKAFPNPATDYVNFEFEGSESFSSSAMQLTITSVTGQKVYSQPVQSTKIKVITASYQKGTYIYHLSNKNKLIKTGKFIVN
jgi:N-acetylneuraminic acid mutarotase